MGYNDYAGTKYAATKDMGRAELKALILGELKAAVKAGELPKCKLSMREGRGSFSLTVTVSDVSFPILNAERVRLDETQPNTFVEEYRCPRLTSEASSLLKRISAMVEAYNYDRSDIQTDYFNVRFYLHVEFKAAEVEAQKRAIIDAASPLRRELRTLVESSFAVMNDTLIESGAKPWRYGPGEAGYFATQFDKVMAKRGMKTTLAATVHALKAKLATVDDWSDGSRAVAA